MNCEIICGDAKITEFEHEESIRESKENRLVSYAMLMLRLQEMCGLTYKEARAYLMPHWESEKRFAEDIGITIESVRSLRRRAVHKVQCSGFRLSQIVGGYGNILLTDLTFELL